MPLPPIVLEYFAASHPDIPEDLQYLPIDQHRKIYKSYRIVKAAQPDVIQQREDSMVDYLVFMLIPWCVSYSLVWKSLIAAQAALQSLRRRKKDLSKRLGGVF
jgi:hypothetical protein